jgi:membrane protease YdiL (CAAX protease family)
LTPIDHGVAALLALVCLGQLFARIDPQSIRRMALYAAGIWSGLLFASLPLLACWVAGRSPAAIGLGMGPVSSYASLAAILWSILLALAVLLLGRGLLRGRVLVLYRHYAWLMPRNRRELAVSWATSGAAGIGEEIAFRGFLLWYGGALVGAPAALILSSLLFGAAHAYQRLPGIFYTGLAGLLLGGVYLTSGSLALAVWMHVTWNMASFALGRILLSTGGQGRASL